MNSTDKITKDFMPGTLVLMHPSKMFGLIVGKYKLDSNWCGYVDAYHIIWPDFDGKLRSTVTWNLNFWIEDVIA